MKKNLESGAGIVAAFGGGFVLLVLLLFLATGGAFILGLLMAAAVPFAFAFVVLEAAFGKKPVYVTSFGDEMARAAPAAAAREPEAISVRVVRAEGACSLGYHFSVGDTWVVNGGLKRGSLPLCPPAYRAILSYVDSARSGEAEGPGPAVCCTDGRALEFELVGGGARSLAGAPR